MTVTYQASLMPSAAGLTQISRDEANRFLDAWGHYLGPIERPFGAEAWALEVAGQPVSVAVSASTVSATAAGLPRTQLVELARLCTDPAARWATRPMLRLWREVCGPAWSYWPAVAAVAYSQNARHDGTIYRFDGWTKVHDDLRSGGGGTWTRKRATTDTAAGTKSLWLWRYDHHGATA